MKHFNAKLCHNIPRSGGNKEEKYFWWNYKRFREQNYSEVLSTEVEIIPRETKEGLASCNEWNQKEFFKAVKALVLLRSLIKGFSVLYSSPT